MINAWDNKTIIKKKLTVVNLKKELNKSGLPVLYDKNKLYIDNRTNNTLIIGASGSGKTQTIILPELELINMANENAIIHDTTDKIYTMTKDKFLNNGYRVVKMDFNNLKGIRYWNPFENIKKEDIWKVGYYLFNDIPEYKKDNILDGIVNYFVMLVLYSLENENVSFKSISYLHLKAKNGIYTFYEKVPKHIKKDIDLTNLFNLSDENKKIIFNIFDKRLRHLVNEELIRKLKINFSIETLKTKKTIVYLISNEKNSLVSLFINQIYDDFKYNSFKKGIPNKIRMNIILDDFYLINPIYNFNNVLKNSKKYKIKFTIVVRRLNDLKNNYGIKEYKNLGFQNTIYILADDYETLMEICKTITRDDKKSLILHHELKALDSFEMVLLIDGIQPFKTKLIPYYKIKNWK